MLDEQLEVKEFHALDDLWAFLALHPGKIPILGIVNTAITDELIEFFSTLQPRVYWTGGIIEISPNLHCSRSHFERLFDGKLLSPISICFTDLSHIEVNLFSHNF